jgi:hypothetical protein
MNGEAAGTPATSSEDATGRVAASARVGMFAPFDLLERGPEAARALLARAGEAGIGHVCCGDHVSFAGAGFDGLVQATALAILNPTLPIYSGVYLLPLRHPILVARQLADIDRIAPGRLIFGVGVGGEDRHEVSICGVNPSDAGPADERMPHRPAPAPDRRGGQLPRQVLRPRESHHRPASSDSPHHRRPLRCGDQAGRPAGRWLVGYLEFAPALCRRRRDGSREAARIGRLDPPARHGCRYGAGWPTPGRRPAPCGVSKLGYRR